MNNSSIFLEGGNRAQTQELRLTFRSKFPYAVCRGLLTYVYDFERLKLKFYTSNHRNFSVNLSIVFLFCKRRNLNPTTKRTSRTSSRWSSTRKVGIQNWYYIILFEKKIWGGVQVHIIQTLQKLKQLLFTCPNVFTTFVCYTCNWQTYLFIFQSNYMHPLLFV